MSRLAPPPLQLPADAPTVVLPPGFAVVRFYDPQRGGGRTHRFYGPLAAMRFDHHPPPCRLHTDRSVWYTAASLRGAVAEAFGRQGFLDRAAGFRVIQAVVRDATPVLDLVGLAPRALRLTQEIAATTDYLACQHWARAFYDRYPEIRGLRWRGRQSGSLCVMLHDRADMNRLDGESWAMTDPAVWPRIARAARDCRLRVV